MSNLEAKDAAVAWLRERGWPDRMDGHVVQLIEFASDEDALFFYPDKSPGFFAMTTRAINKRCRTRKAKVQRLTLRPADFRTWLEEDASREDTPAARRQFAEHAQRILHTAAP